MTFVDHFWQRNTHLCPQHTTAKKSTPVSVSLCLHTKAPSIRSPATVVLSLSRDDSEPTFPPESFSRLSKYLIEVGEVDGNGLVSNGVSGGRPNINRQETIRWLDTLANDCLGHDYDVGPDGRRPFSILSWNILAQSLYESQYQRRRIQEVALSSSQIQMPSFSSSPHPHPWSKRVKRIVEILSHSDADIICLQEATARSFKNDLLPELSKIGYDGIAQEDDRPDKPMCLREASKHRHQHRNHITATLWKRDKFEPLGEAIARTRSLVTVLKLKGTEPGNGSTPTVAVVNVHLEGHPRRFSERTQQLYHAMSDLAKRVEQNSDGPSRTEDDTSRIGKLNALVLAGDFNCELQSSACSTYLRVGRIGKHAGLGGIYGGDSLVLPPALFDTAEAAEVIQPIMEWGRVLPEHKLADLSPHPFRRNCLSSAYPPWLGEDDARSHFTFCR